MPYSVPALRLSSPLFDLFGSSGCNNKTRDRSKTGRTTSPTGYVDSEETKQNPPLIDRDRFRDHLLYYVVTSWGSLT